MTGNRKLSISVTISPVLSQGNTDMNMQRCVHKNAQRSSVENKGILGTI